MPTAFGIPYFGSAKKQELPKEQIFSTALAKAARNTLEDAANRAALDDSWQEDLPTLNPLRKGETTVPLEPSEKEPVRYVLNQPPEIPKGSLYFSRSGGTPNERWLPGQEPTHGGFVTAAGDPAEAEKRYNENLYGPEEVSREDMAVAKNRAYQNEYENGNIPELGNKGSFFPLTDSKGVIQGFYNPNTDTFHESPVKGAMDQKTLVAQAAGPKLNSTLQTRVAAAQGALDSERAIKEELSKPQVKAVLGPVAGRISNVQQFLGAPPPELQRLAGMLHGYMLNTMGVHGMRNAQEAGHLFDQLYGAKMTPEAILAAVQGLNEIPRFFSTYGQQALAGQQVGQTLRQPQVTPALGTTQNSAPAQLPSTTPAQGSKFKIISVK